jgi:hypothetical protein
MLGTRVYLVFATQRLGYPIDEAAAHEEKIILGKENLPSWMEFNTLYCFLFTDFNDASESAFKIHVRCFKQRADGGPDLPGRAQDTLHRLPHKGLPV